jgi:hypothetical protein
MLIMGKGVNHSPLQLYGKFVSINKRHKKNLHSKVIWVEQNNSSPLGKDVFYKEENYLHIVLKGSIQIGIIEVGSNTNGIGTPPGMLARRR